MWIGIFRGRGIFRPRWHGRWRGILYNRRVEKIRYERIGEETIRDDTICHYEDEYEEEDEDEYE